MSWYLRGVRRFAILLALALTAGFAAPRASAEPPRTQQHEVLTDRPSGFWTSTRPAVNGAYRYKLLGVGLVIAVVTGVAMLRLIKRANADRAARALPRSSK